jgi:hypothetical protein
MRTTLTIDDDALRIARRFAKGRRISIGKAVSDLVRKSAEAPLPTKTVNGLTIFDLPADSPRVTSEQVRKLLEDES